MMNLKLTSRDNLLAEFQSRFKAGLFEKSENYNKKVHDAIWISKKCCASDGIYLINFETWDLHPDFEIFLEKYDAWIEPTEDLFGFFVFIKIKTDVFAKQTKDHSKNNLSFRLSLQNIKISV